MDHIQQPTEPCPPSSTAVPFNEQPLLSLLKLDQSKMTDLELTQYVTELQRLRIPQAVRAAANRAERVDRAEKVVQTSAQAQAQQQALDLI